MLVGSWGRLPKLTHGLGFTCKLKGYKSLSYGDERERYWEGSHHKASFSGLCSISAKALHKFCN